MTLTAADIAAMQVTQEAALPDTCSVLTRGTTRDTTGAPKETFTATYTGVPCRLAARSGSERISADRKTEFAVYTLSVPYDQALDETMQVLSSDGVTFRVVFVDSGKSWSTVKRADVERVS